MKGNKGEWSELYVLLKLISEGRVYGADKNLNQIDDMYYDILKMIRKQTEGTWEYERSNNINIIQQETGELILSVPILDFRNNCGVLLDEMSKIRSSNGSFEIPKLSDFIKQIKICSLKAKSVDKADIFIKIHDYKTGFDPTLGFSIKSMLGSPSTLLNAGGTTNFKYEVVDNISDKIMMEFNQIFRIRGTKVSPDFRKRFEYLKAKNTSLTYVDICNRTFKNNLILIDSSLPEICAWMIREFYTVGNSICLENINCLSDMNPLNYDLDNGQPFYHYKFKKMLSESALGMLPGKVWNGLADATGGYLIVKEDGEVLCYHLYNRVEFEDYLLSNTRFETPSSSKYDFGSIYKEEDKYYIKLNMQIRFLK